MQVTSDGSIDSSYILIDCLMSVEPYQFVVFLKLALQVKHIFLGCLSTLNLLHYVQVVSIWLFLILFFWVILHCFCNRLITNIPLVVLLDCFDRQLADVWKSILTLELWFERHWLFLYCMYQCWVVTTEGVVVVWFTWGIILGIIIVFRFFILFVLLIKEGEIVWIFLSLTTVGLLRWIL